MDSAKIDEVRQAVELGYLAGVTTNPTIMAKAKGQPKEILRQICAVSPGPVFYQVTANTAAERECYVIPYVNRASRLLGDGHKLVAEMAAVLKASGKDAEILAASIKSAEEATQAILAGANHLTLPMDILLSLGNHPLSDAAIEEFGRAGLAG